MAKGGNQKQFTRASFLEKGYVELPDGSFQPPNLDRNKTIPIAAQLVQKQKVNESPDFEVKVPSEWFIKNYNVPSKKNSRQNFVRNGKQISIPSKNHAEYVKMTAMQYKVFGIEFRAAVKHYNLVTPLYIQFKFIRSSRHRFDYCNAAQTCEDLMVSNDWVGDDSADHIIPVFVPYEYDKEVPGVYIKLLINK